MYLNDIRGRHVKAEHVLAAIERASAGLVEEGMVDFHDCELLI